MDFGALKVLVIDDQDFVRTIVKKMLEQVGIGSVLDARDGAEGLKMVVSERPDLVLCDVQMRPMNGLDFVKTLRETPLVADTPVIMLTAHTDTATVESARELSVAGFLAKPVLPRTLKERIEQTLGG